MIKKERARDEPCIHVWCFFLCIRCVPKGARLHLPSRRSVLDDGRIIVRHPTKLNHPPAHPATKPARWYSIPLELLVRPAQLAAPPGSTSCRKKKANFAAESLQVKCSQDHVRRAGDAWCGCCLSFLCAARARGRDPVGRRCRRHAAFLNVRLCCEFLRCSLLQCTAGNRNSQKVEEGSACTGKRYKPLHG